MIYEGIMISVRNFANSEGDVSDPICIYIRDQDYPIKYIYSVSHPIKYIYSS